MALTQITTDGIKDGTITGTDLATNIDLVDNQKLRLGTGNDLQIYHTGTESVIGEVGTGNLVINATSLDFFNNDLGGSYARFISNGAVELYHAGSKKFETTSGGAAVVGTISVSGNVTAGGVFNSSVSYGSTAISLGDNQQMHLGASNDLKLLHDSANSYLSHTGTGNLYIQADPLLEIRSSSNAETYAKFIQNGAVELYHDNSKKFETISSGVQVSGTLFIPDGGQASNRISVGNSGDLQIYHNGSNSFIDESTGTGRLIIRTGGMDIKTEASAETIATFNMNGAVELYHDNEKKLNTTAGGVQVTGDFSTTGSGGTITANENLKIPNDTGKLLLGASNDLQIYHNGTNNYLDSIGSSQIFYNRPNNDWYVSDYTSNENRIKAIQNGAVELYYDGSKKFETTSSGTRVTGMLHFAAAGTPNISVPDNGKIAVGTNDDIEIFHNGTDSKILNGAGDFIVGHNNGIVRIDANHSNNEVGILVRPNGAVELYHNNSKKFETTSAGNHSFGQMTFDGRIYPNADNAYTCGLSNRRWTEVCAVNGSINTSDKTEKNTIVESDLGLDFVNKLKPISFKWNKDDGKTHYGLVVQDIEETILSLGKSITDFGGISKEEDSPMGLGYCELISPLIKAIQELSAEVAALKAG